jgi:hypothetical protein
MVKTAWEAKPRSDAVFDARENTAGHLRFAEALINWCWRLER